MNSTVKRTLIGVLFLVVMVGSLLAGPVLWIPVFVIILQGCMLEFFKMTVGAKHRPAQIVALAAASASFVLSYCVAGGLLPAIWLSLNLVSVILLMLVMVFDITEVKDYPYIFTSLLYIGFPVSLSPFMVLDNGVFDGTLMLSFFILIWASDTGAYCFGMLLGQKIWPLKLCPRISPKKSWAGALGGFVTALAVSLLLKEATWLPFSTAHVLVLAALINVMSVFGDLFESLWKRSAGVKDSGNILPGHGGLLDRFDSSLFAIPVAYVYLLIFSLV